MALSEKGILYSWGFANNGKLGIGTSERSNVKAPYNRYFAQPNTVTGMKGKIVKQVSCGPNHTLALVSDGTYSWGSGDGFRLGHGDDKDRLKPAKITGLAKDIVLQVSAGCWHSACIVLVPPLREAGWVGFIRHPFHHSLLFLDRSS